jgi:L-ribulose-5-phosphate 3-epimerase UlaE
MKICRTKGLLIRYRINPIPTELNPISVSPISITKNFCVRILAKIFTKIIFRFSQKYSYENYDNRRENFHENFRESFRRHAKMFSFPQTLHSWKIIDSIFANQKIGVNVIKTCVKIFVKVFADMRKFSVFRKTLHSWQIIAGIFANQIGATHYQSLTSYRVPQETVKHQLFKDFCNSG